MQCLLRWVEGEDVQIRNFCCDFLIQSWATHTQNSEMTNKCIHYFYVNREWVWFLSPFPPKRAVCRTVRVCLNTTHSCGLEYEENVLHCPGLCLLKTPPWWEEAIEFAFPPAQLEQGFSGSQTKAVEIVWEDKKGTVWTSRKLRGEWDWNVASKQSHFYFMPCWGGGRTWGGLWKFVFMDSGWELQKLSTRFGRSFDPQPLDFVPLPASHS